MDKKKISRLRRAKSTRKKIAELGMPRLCVNRTPRHMYVQLISATQDQVLASASTLDADVKAALTGYTGNKDAASLLGKMIAEKAKTAGIEKVAFDRSGFKYHGRIAALADAARDNGLKF
jgi:large subunit ribosomal protein L18